MGYLGGKYRIRYEVAEYINQLSPKVYLECFCGLAWIGERVIAQRRIFTDLNADVIAMWRALKKGWKPPTSISEEEYAEIRKSKGPTALRGFAGTTCSFGGLFLNTYARNREQPVNFAAQGARVLAKRIRTLRSNSTFGLLDYMEAIRRSNADVIYCDPPYAGTTEYTVGSFNHDEFWANVRRLSDGTRRVLVSEYTVPSDFTIVLETSSRMGLATGSTKNGGLERAVRRELLVEFNPPTQRRKISFGRLF